MIKPIFLKLSSGEELLVLFSNLSSLKLSAVSEEKTGETPKTDRQMAHSTETEMGSTDPDIDTADLPTVMVNH